jgi:hypothetical protein
MDTSQLEVGEAGYIGARGSVIPGIRILGNAECASGAGGAAAAAP